MTEKKNLFRQTCELIRETELNPPITANIKIKIDADCDLESVLGALHFCDYRYRGSKDVPNVSDIVSAKVVVDLNAKSFKLAYYETIDREVPKATAETIPMSSHEAAMNVLRVRINTLNAQTDEYIEKLKTYRRDLKQYEDSYSELLADKAKTDIRLREARQRIKGLKETNNALSQAKVADFFNALAIQIAKETMTETK